MMRGMNMGKMMKQVKKLQKQMGSDQRNINQQEFVGKSPENLVTVTFTGDHQMQDIKMDPKASDPKDPDTLSDLIVSATNDAMKKIDSATKNALGKYTKNIPGM